MPVLRASGALFAPLGGGACVESSGASRSSSGAASFDSADGFDLESRVPDVDDDALLAPLAGTMCR